MCAALFGYALFSQYVLGLEPCPLCVFQRVALIGLAVVLIVAALHDPGTTGARIYGIAALIAAGVGAAIAGRHVWLQSLPPDEVPACGPGLDYMLDAFPFTEMLGMVFSGSGECAEVDWSFLGLSMPTWVLIWFVGLGIAALVWNWRRV